jgi:hypothetical protein
LITVDYDTARDFKAFSTPAHRPTQDSPALILDPRALRRKTGLSSKADMTTEYFRSGTKIGRGMAQRSLDLIEAMRVITEAAQPITGRGVGYKLFTQGLIPSMSRGEMAKVYRLLRQAREEYIIPWSSVVDETRSIERTPTWDNPEDYARCEAETYRRDFWNQQPHRVQVWSEKGTVFGAKWTSNGRRCP